MGNIFLLSFVGFFVTLYSVSLGRSGGLLYVGILTSFVGAPPEVAVATSLAILVPTALVGSWSHWRQGNIRLKIGSVLFLSGALGALAGSLSGHLISPHWYRKFLGALLLWSFLKVVWSHFRKKVSSEKPQSEKHPHWIISLYGFLGGVFSSLTGTGGSTPVIAGLMTTECSPIEIIGTSLFAIAGIATTGFLMHFHSGQVNWLFAAEICAGAIAGSFFSPILLGKIPRKPFDRFMKPIIAVLIAGMGIYMSFF